MYLQEVEAPPCDTAAGEFQVALLEGIDVEEVDGRGVGAANVPRVRV